MSEYKSQHYVPAFYLRAWCDPAAPEGHAPFVWVISKDGKEIIRKAPRNLFEETDFYTVTDIEGERLLELEHRLGEVETAFSMLKRTKLERHLPLKPEDRKSIALFAATMFSRTRFHKDLQQDMWQELLDGVEELPSEIQEEIKKTGNYQQIQQLQHQPMPFLMFQFVNLAVPYLLRMNCSIQEVNGDVGLLTSDNPCIWIDPQMIIHPSTFFSLGSPTLNVLLPISPTQLLSLERQGPDGYITIGDDIVDIINPIIVDNAEKYVVSNTNQINLRWFM